MSSHRIAMGGRLSLFTAIAAIASAALPKEMPPMPKVPAPLPIDSVPMGDASAFEEQKLDLPREPGPFLPTWQSIEAEYPGEPSWLREAKFGIWVHFGPQAAGQSGDWYARNMYKPGYLAYENHLKQYGPPSEFGYKEVLRDWNPTKLDPTALTKLYREAGARFLLIQGVHCDNFDLWNSRYQPWNSTRMGPKRDLVGEWAKAAKAAGMRFDVTFHNEYSWYWWQTVYGADKTGPEAGVQYDGRLTLADGKGQWWEGLDPKLLYPVDLREYKGIEAAAESQWQVPSHGIFTRHLDYARWYATRFALRMMDVIDQYDPDFIYTDGIATGPFCGEGSGSGYKCDALENVLAYYYNHALNVRGAVDTFSIIKFRPKTNGTVNTREFGVPEEIKTDQPWIAEAPVGDWYYRPGFTYDAGSFVRYIIEAVARDGNAAICVSPRPDGSLDQGSIAMLRAVGAWMRINGEAIYGSHAWAIPGEGETVAGKLKMLRGGKLDREQAEMRFSPDDVRFTVGKNGSLYVLTMAPVEPGRAIRVHALGFGDKSFARRVSSVELLGSSEKVLWRQSSDALEIKGPQYTAQLISSVFRIGIVP